MICPKEFELEQLAGHLSAQKIDGAAIGSRALPGTRASIQAEKAAARRSAFQRWIVVCEAASVDFRAFRCDLLSTQDYQLHAEPCLEHGESCLRLICGVMMQHVRWESTEPTRAAAELL